MNIENRFSLFDQNIVSDLFGDEVVLVNLETGVYYSLRGSAAQVWIRIENHFNSQEILESLTILYSNFTKDAELEIVQFIHELWDKKLIKHIDNLEQVPLSAIGLEKPYTPPVMEMYSDMQDILLLDPVHDVDKTGWPLPKDDSDKSTPS